MLAGEVRVVGVKRPLNILQNTVLHFDSESLVFLLVELDEELACVDGASAAAPLHEVLETLWVFKDRADSAQAETFQALLTALSEVKKNVNSLDVQKVELAPFVAENSV